MNAEEFEEILEECQIEIKESQKQFEEAMERLLNSF